MIYEGTDITIDLEPMWDNRSRRRGGGIEEARIPYRVRVNALSPATSDIDEIEDRIVVAVETHLSATPFRARVPFIGISEIATISGEAGLWRLAADFASRGGWSDPELGMCAAFETVGGTQSIKTSIQTRTVYGKAPPADAARLIGWTTDGQVEGVDIIVPAMNWGFDVQLSPTVVTDAYIIGLFYLTGKVNTDTYRGFAPGEVLFLGATGRRESAGTWTISYRFSSLPNQTVANGNAITIPGLKDGGGTPYAIEKFGWDYLWLGYEKKDDGPAKTLYPKPVSAFVEKVYPGGAFAATIGM